MVDYYILVNHSNIFDVPGLTKVLVTKRGKFRVSTLKELQQVRQTGDRQAILAKGSDKASV